jgi:beta-lactam-binding protein with PASTA domain
MISSDVIGRSYDTVQAELTDKGYDTRPIVIAADQLGDFLAAAGIDESQAYEGAVIGTEPAPGETLTEGQTITLFVSAGVGDKPHGKAKGHDKEKD